MRHLVILISLFSLGLIGCCSTTSAKLAPGLCLENIDCPQGERCVQGYCEDIYYPKSKRGL